MRRFKKDDVEFHNSGYGSTMYPAINVKVNGNPDRVELPLVLNLVADTIYDEAGEVIGHTPFVEVKTDDAFTHEWIEANVTESTRNAVWEFTCGDAYEMFKADLTDDVFKDERIKVWSEGRSGGWVIVEGLKDFESWDAVDVARWAKACRYAKAYVDDVPRQYIVSLYSNEFEAQQRAFVEQAVNGLDRLIP